MEGGFLTLVSSKGLFYNLTKLMEIFLTFVKFQKFILKSQQNNGGFFNFC